MAKKDDPIPAYGCMMPNPDLRRVDDPREEQPAPKNKVRRLAAKLLH